MLPTVRPGTKGRVRVEVDDTRLYTEATLRDLAHELRKLRGVKRAMVRTENGVKFVFVRINDAFEGMVEKIDQKVRQFHRRLFVPPAPRRKGSRVLHNKPLAMRTRQRCKRYPPKYMPVAA